ncbi:uncharacterized protein N7459_003617 [Penicillium hispanicum]|uniref:uncharacterized protein n=1 Tax=Penicillium hispanicum TaxID=1080232 RepID=UPI0025426025|nr:uncharacterized protein N7459_003617 [Penicillium hispanicum]KAJ5587852.1 hypothetical protein N7459_003617 [Penicillium hispanicum]
MSTDTSTPSSPAEAPTNPPKGPEASTAPAEEFISLGGDEDFIGFGAASDAEDGTDSDDDASEEDEDSFHPHRITLPAFRKLLSCYPTTLEQVQRRKTMLKLQPKPEKGSKRSAEKKAGSASANLRGAALLQKTDFNPSELKYIREETERFARLDAWRYETMPRALAERRGLVGADGEAGMVKSETFFDKQELITIMDWKTQHGLPRPTLMGMVKSNQNKNVLRCAAAAINALPTADPMLAPNEAFPKASIDALQPLRGVGTATASLMLSIATGCGDADHQVPFYSDDVYLWLCLKDFPETESKPKQLISNGGAEPSKPKKKVSKFKRPNGELNVKYNIAEYRNLWDASWELQKRMNRAVEAEAEAGDENTENGNNQDGEKKTEGLEVITHVDIEKVAYVLRNIAVSGFYPDVDPTEILQAHADQEAKAIAYDKAEKERRAAKAAAEVKKKGGKKDDKDGAGKKRKREKDEGKNKGSRNSKKNKKE